MALTITRIPEPYRPGLAKIRKLTPEALSDIANAMATVAPGGGVKEMIAAVENVPSVGKEDAIAIVRTLYSLYNYRASTETLLAEFVPVLVAAMQASGDASFTLSEGEKDLFSQKLTRLLGLGSLELSSKVEQLKTDYRSIFCDAKILTDLRPVFADPGAAPVGVAITYTLKIAYHEDGDHKELYFALDAEDLHKLRKVIDRAEVKASSLKSVIATANLQDLS
jgi:hypothetical protein